MKLHLYSIITSFALVALIFNSGKVFSQEDAKETVEEATKNDAKVALSFLKDNDNKSSVKVKISHKDKETKELMLGVNMEVLLYINEADPANLIGKETTNNKGIAVFQMNALFYAIADTSSIYNFVLVMPENETYNEVEEELSIQVAKLEIEVYEKDSIRYIKAHLQSKSDTGYAPIAEVSLSFGIKCTFSNLPFGGEYTTTDEDGYVIVEFPTDVVGDENGDVEIVVSYKEDEAYGVVEKTAKVNWAKPLVIDNSDIQHKLWSSRANAPVPLVVISLLIIIGIWGTLFYLMFDLLKIRKLGKK